MSQAMKFHVLVEKAPEGGYVVQCVEIPGAISEGPTLKEALENVADAIEGVLEVRRREARRKVKGSHGGRRRLASVEVDA